MKSQTRVLYVDHAPVVGGAELSLIELIAGLESEFVTAVACAPDSSEFAKKVSDQETGLFVIDMPRLRRGSAIPLIRGVRNLTRVIREFKPDILHTNTVRTHILGAIAGRLTGVKVVWHIRDFTFPLPIYRLLCQTASRIIFISKAIEKIYGGGVKTCTILNGTVAPEIDADGERARIRNEFALGNDVPLIVIVGQLFPWKGQDRFLQAAALVKQRIPAAKLMVVGTGDEAYSQHLKQLAEQLCIADSVIFTGYRSDPISFMCAADLVVHASVKPEGFGRVLTEAMSIGRPIIGSVFGAPCEVIEDGVSGLLADPTKPTALAQAMISVLTDTDFADRLSLGAKDRFESDFTQIRETEEIVAVYNSMLNG